jgi:hypothetical protein
MSDLDCYRCGTDLDRDDLSEPVLFEGEERFLCDPCNLATRVLLYTRPEPPFVDVGLYQESCSTPASSQPRPSRTRPTKS